ncbi:BZ3500_MvSof-1268-A1-R1_Chr1-1g00890 [Microbotryum saponariae]|uniref:BZ3500_MvSof-1268-A1-R1_Chr1-1g00890 protein n=1 Tax=Microbotryum saponariae TaxID=289078 RepID=A0A2X0K8P0_9BASI|nr:BZ3500_MvSof-1268-A1-R1_Chr1-1g00890 [Microbotryum saponariae]SCZ92869.1 BZ3501_MvSof-1269-A2-R1_Chr1-1g00487 [Microbotryum saponariae]
MLRRLGRVFSTTPSSNTSHLSTQVSTMSTASATNQHLVNTTPEEWRKAIAALPALTETEQRIPAIFLAHGQPMLITPPELLSDERKASLGEVQGPNGALVQFLKDLGPALVEKYNPKAIVVLSAHWESRGGALVSDWQDENPLLFDCQSHAPNFTFTDKRRLTISSVFTDFGFHPALYKVEFHSSPDHALSERVVHLLKSSNISARLLGPTEKRGDDGRGFRSTGLDHGVFVPFKHMFTDNCPIPIVQVSINQSLLPQDEYDLGAALEPLRSEGVLIISGGLTIHTFQDFNAFSLSKSPEIYKEFEKSIIDAAAIDDPVKRKKALFDTAQHPGFRKAHPREEHYAPIWIAAGAADKQGGKASTLMGHHGCKTIAFGV